MAQMGLPVAVEHAVTYGHLCMHTQIVARKMKGGAIVNISSQASTRAFKDHTAYCTSKGALDQLTRMMALEYVVGSSRLFGRCSFSLFVFVTSRCDLKR